MCNQIRKCLYNLFHSNDICYEVRTKRELIRIPSSGLQRGSNLNGNEVPELCLTPWGIKEETSRSYRLHLGELLSDERGWEAQELGGFKCGGIRGRVWRLVWGRRGRHTVKQ